MTSHRDFWTSWFSCERSSAYRMRRELTSARTIEQPLKIPFVAATVLLANAQKPDLTTDVLAKIGDALQQQLILGKWREVKLYLRFLGCLQGIFEGEGIFAILEELFSRAADLQMKSSEDVRLFRPIFGILADPCAGPGTRARQSHSLNHPLRDGVVRNGMRKSGECFVGKDRYHSLNGAPSRSLS